MGKFDILKDYVKIKKVSRICKQIDKLYLGWTNNYVWKVNLMNGECFNGCISGILSPLPAGAGDEDSSSQETKSDCEDPEQS